MRYCSSLRLKGLQNCKRSKLEIRKKTMKNDALFTQCENTNSICCSVVSQTHTNRMACVHFSCSLRNWLNSGKYRSNGWEFVVDEPRRCESIIFNCLLALLCQATQLSARKKPLNWNGSWHAPQLKTNTCHACVGIHLDIGTSHPKQHQLSKVRHLKVIWST